MTAALIPDPAGGHWPIRVFYIEDVAEQLQRTAESIVAEFGPPREGLAVTSLQVLGKALVPFAQRTLPAPIGTLLGRWVWRADDIDALARRKAQAEIAAGGLDPAVLATVLTAAMQPPGERQ